MVAGAPAVKNVEEEQRLDDGLALNQKMEAEDAREEMEVSDEAEEILLGMQC